MRTSFAIMALLGAAAAVRFEPTDPEFYAATEAEVYTTNAVLRRKRDAYDHDPNTVSQYDDMPQHGRISAEEIKLREERHKKYGTQRIHGDSRAQRPARDAYDLDPDTVSQYDDMRQHQRRSAESDKDHKDLKEKFGAQRIHGDTRAQIRSGHSHRHHHKHHHGKKDAYDYDTHTTSEFDDASNINGGSPYMKAIGDAPSGPNVKVLEEKIADKLKKNKALKEQVASPDIPEARSGADAREGFAGAIARDRKGNMVYEDHGATKEQVRQQEEAERLAAEAAKKADAEAEKVADEAVADEEKKAEKKAAGEKAAKAPVDPSAENAKAVKETPAEPAVTAAEEPSANDKPAKEPAF